MRPQLLFAFLLALPSCTPLRGGSDRGEAGDSTGPASQDATSQAESDTATPCALYHPPEPPKLTDGATSASPAGTVTTDLVFAVSNTVYGTLPTGDGGPPRYTMIGFDLDNACTGMDSCVEPSWASGLHHVGVDGIDNAFGEYVGLGFPDSVDASANGSEILFRVSNYSGATDQDPIDVSLYGGLGLVARDDGGVGPFWDGNDRWKILPDFLVNPGNGAVPSVDQPRFHADRAYVRGGTLVARFDKAPVPAALVNLPSVLVTAHQLTISGKLTRVSDGGGSWELDDVTLGFRVSMADALLVLGLTVNQMPTNGDPNQTYCQDKAAYDVGKQYLCEFADISADPNAPPTAACDGLSVGSLFQARQARLGEVAQPAQPLPTCATGVALGTDTCDTLSDQ